MPIAHGVVAEEAGADWEEKPRARVGKVCVHRRFWKQRGIWTVAAERKEACLSCASACRPCCVWDGETIAVLPLPEGVRAEGVVAGELGFFVMAEKDSIGKENRALWVKYK